jgi:hypothetical protein
MIIDEPTSKFIFVYHPLVLMGRSYTVYEGRPLTNGEVLTYWGKWLVLAERPWLDELAEKLDPYVESKEIPCIKYDRRPPANLGVEECVMMVYCDRRKRDDVWKILSRFGIKMKAWVTERETLEMWLPGGVLLERWIASQDYDQDMAEAVRKDAARRIGLIFDHPEEIYRSWEQ